MVSPQRNARVVTITPITTVHCPLVHVLLCFSTDRTSARSSCEQESIQPRTDTPPQTGAPAEKLIHLALPVRLTHMQNGERSVLELACTYDIHPRGARLLSFRNVNVGDLITVERGRHKSICQVVWTADPNSALRGQFTVECVEGNRIPWEEELRIAQEQYLPILPDGPRNRPAMNTFQNRRAEPAAQSPIQR